MIFCLTACQHAKYSHILCGKIETFPLLILLLLPLLQCVCPDLEYVAPLTRENIGGFSG